jgi:ubiquinone/menaquinone biosynthesis C-methylase UbiE
MTATDQNQNEMLRSRLPGLKLPTRAEVEAAVGPYITRRMPVESPEWREIAESQRRKEEKIHRRQKVRSILPWKKQARPQTLVSDHYETHWAEVEWPRTSNPDPSEQGVLSIWDKEGMMIRRFGRKRPHHLLFARLVRELKPKTALEVGAGNGINLLVMSTLFPEIQWSGVELTEAGVQVAKSVQKEERLPARIQEFAVDPIIDPAGHRKATFQQGDASALPFKDKQFDLVFSFQALEQMQAIRDKAVSEISRVAAKYVICTEPFRDFNQSEIQKYYTTARGYLNLAIDELPSFGLRPFLRFGDWPHKLTLGVGLAAADVSR